MNRLEPYGIAIEHEVSPTGIGGIGPHEHETYEIYYLVSGNRRYLMQHTVYDVVPGNLVFVPRKQLHRTVSTARTGYDRYVLYFSHEQAKRLSELLGEESFAQLMDSGCIALPKTISEEIHRDMELLSREIGNRNPLTEAIRQ